MESTKVSRTYDVFTPGTLSAAGGVLSEDTVNRTEAYLAKTAIKEDLEKEYKELEDLEALEIHEADEQAKATQLSVEKEKKRP